MMRRPKLAGTQVLLGDLMQAALPIGANLGTLFTGRSLARAPAFLTWVLTERCPMRCRHCDMGKPSQELDEKGRLALARQLADSGVWGVSLLGGEATLVEDLGEICAILKGGKKWVSVGSSGYRLDEHLAELVELPIDSITLSADSHRAVDHDAFRGRVGLFDDVLAAIDTIYSQRRGVKPQVQVRCTVHRENFRELADYLAFWETRVDNVLLQVVQDNGLHQVRDHDVMFLPEDRADLETVFAEIARLHPGLNTRHFELAPRFVFEPEELYRDTGFRCLLVPATSAVILSDGAVRLCGGRSDAGVGNVAEESIETIWKREKTRATQRRMQSKSYGCMCWEQAGSGNLDLMAVHDRVQRIFGGSRITGSAE